jgi:hypothetical protein
MPFMTENCDFLLFLFIVRNMLQIKRAADDVAESSKQSRRICTGGEETLDLLISGLLVPALHFFLYMFYYSTTGTLTIVFRHVLLNR